MSDIYLMITGGTIDSEYFPPQETSQPNKESILPFYMSEKIRPHKNIECETLCMLDSGDITDAHRQKMVERIQATVAKKVIITHGTNTMTETAEYLKASLESDDKTVVLTGSMIPLKEFAMSDGGFNLGYAVAQVESLAPGVYICMHGETFESGAVTKNRAEARFEHL